jgi:hypothetical protein
MGIGGILASLGGVAIIVGSLDWSVGARQRPRRSGRAQFWTRVGARRTCFTRLHEVGIAMQAILEPGNIVGSWGGNIIGLGL